MTADPEILFEVETPVSFRVRVTKGRWDLIVQEKHPVMRGEEANIRSALEAPEEVRQSRSDLTVYLFYREQEAKALVLCGGQEGRRRSFHDHGVPDRCNQRGDKNMADLKVFHDRDGKTLTVWFGDSRDEYVCDKTGDEVVLMKDSSGAVIGFEKLNFNIAGSDPLNVSVETAPA